MLGVGRELRGALEMAAGFGAKRQRQRALSGRGEGPAGQARIGVVGLGFGLYRVEIVAGQKVGVSPISSPWVSSR